MSKKFPFAGRFKVCKICGKRYWTLPPNEHNHFKFGDKLWSTFLGNCLFICFCRPNKTTALVLIYPGNEEKEDARYAEVGSLKEGWKRKNYHLTHF